jgi:hypothetical protein
LGVGEGVFQAVEFFEQPSAAFEVARAGLGQSEVAGSAINQPRFQMSFKRMSLYGSVATTVVT